ncbi:PCC domain-containing protein [Methylobacterium oryzihabitans]|uniref:DUF296 domain-containing protein n=1 Tax=Methylobacterium oryzihabitans TaxID=2499852 RepID=A0A437NXP0_9HYPH|nr:DUF296 domain-containing protein [Methylobacterium oryzihabitans]RVU14773.1 DUF296 domain-containing protein [Methylobacterium oryzihabitans]
MIAATRAAGEGPFPPSHLAQPGPARPERHLAAAGRPLHARFGLEPGRTLLDAVTGPLAAQGMRGGVVHLHGGSFDPFAYVMPALSSDGVHAAWYSETYRPAGETRLEAATATFGERDGAPFLHVHGVWVEPDGRRRGGHLLPAEVVVRAPCEAEAWGTAEAAWRVEPDAETNFPLFTPASLGGDGGSVLLKVQPNEELFAAVEAACAGRSIRVARLRGLGSLVRPVFADGRMVPTEASELFIRDGSVGPGEDGRPRAAIDIAVVDVDGAIHEGPLQRGSNAVCITCELHLEVVE